MRGSWIGLVVLACALGWAADATALPPQSVALTQGSLGGRWVEHFVIPGERLAEIAERYAVEVAKIIEWNSLDSDKPMLRVGQTLRVLSRTSATGRKRERYKVRVGDSWSKIAQRYHVDVNKLQKQWNPGAGDLRPGDHVIVWVEREPAPVLEAAKESGGGAAAKLAAVVEPSHGAKPALADVLAAVVEPKSGASEPQLRSAASTSTQQAAKPPAAKAAPVAAAVTKPAATATAKPAPAATKPAATTAKPAATPLPSKPPDLLATLVQPSAKPSPGSTATALRDSAPSTSTKPDGAKPAPSAPAPQYIPGQVTRVGPYKLVPVRAGGMSVGPTNHGRLRNGVQMPVNDALYSIRNPDHSWGSSHAVEQLQVGMAIFRQQTGFKRQILICDMSVRGGGRFRPHHSHTSGRDVDIRLPLRAGISEQTIPENPAVVDWDMTWAMIKAFVATGEVQYVFLARSRLVHLYKAAQRAGESPEDLTVLIQYPGHGRNTLIRHSAGHTKHIHVRWKCAADAELCVE